MKSCKILYPIQTSFLDYPDNQSLALVICFIGCEHNCPGCQNKELQSLDYSNGVLEFESFDEVKSFINHDILNLLKRNHTNKIVFSGGDPLMLNNREFLDIILQTLPDDIDVCVYTGYMIDKVKEMDLHFNKIKYFKCGPFIKSLSRESYKNDIEMCLASSNQGIYDNKFNELSNNGILKF